MLEMEDEEVVKRAESSDCKLSGCVEDGEEDEIMEVGC